MATFRFRVILSGPFADPVTDDELLDATDVLGDAGCTDCSISVRGRRLELEFERAGESLQGAISSAIHDVERSGYVVEAIEMDRDALPVGSS